MSAFLKYVEVQDFKSFKGNFRIGPLKPFTAVIGPNGSGKSNFMDAISFVMGEKPGALRMRRTSDLIHGAPMGSPVSKSAYVSATIQLEYEKELEFKRSIHGSTSHYFINGTEVSVKDYLSELEKLNINVKAKNFLVYQGSVEAIAMKTPKEITAMFEEICGSNALKEDYEIKRKSMQKAMEDQVFSNKKVKHVNKEKNYVRKQKAECEKYEDIANKVDKKIMVHQLFQLYNGEQEIKDLQEEEAPLLEKADGLEQKRSEKEAVIKEKKKELGVKMREIANIEQEIREVDVEVSKAKPRFINAKEKASHAVDKLDSAKKLLQQALKSQELKVQGIVALERELKELKNEKKDLEMELSQSQSPDVELENDEEREYKRLKSEAGKQTSKYVSELDTICREQSVQHDKLSEVTRQCYEAKEMLKFKKQYLQELTIRVEKLTRNLERENQGMASQKNREKELVAKIDETALDLNTVRTEIEAITAEINELSNDKHECKMAAEQEKVVEMLKKMYGPEIYGRLIDLCEIADDKYRVAITRVMGKDMNGIVVETEYIAKECIRRLREQLLARETFFPLDSLKANKITNYIKNLRENEGRTFMLDQIAFQPENIEKVVQFATKNAFICETPQEANELAYQSQERLNVVALDGTYYKQSGIIQGGQMDLERRARRWDQKHVDNLKEKRAGLKKKVEKAERARIQQDNLRELKESRQGKETCISYILKSIDVTRREIQQVENEIEKINDKIADYSCEMKNFENTLQQHHPRTQQLSKKIEEIEDEIFTDFCNNIGVRDIRQYEKRKLALREDLKQKLLDYDQQINRIESTLDYERNENGTSKVERWEAVIVEETETARVWQLQLGKQREEIDKRTKQLNELKNQHKRLEEDVTSSNKEVKRCAEELETLKKVVHEAQKSIIQTNAKLVAAKNRQYNLLRYCQCNNIDIQFSKGNFAELSQISSDAETPEMIDKYEELSNIEINYSLLPKSLRGLKSRKDIANELEKLQAEIRALKEALEEIKDPNLGAARQLEQTIDTLLNTHKEYEQLVKLNKKAKADFEEVKQLRADMFQKCLDQISQSIDSIYKGLTQSNAAEAYLNADNPEEPYLEGISYSCVAPGKRYQNMSTLSGGEKTMAALALLFAIHSYQPSPFLVLDEVDAALDKVNVEKTISYIQRKKNDLQIIMITLNESCFAYADLLVGITKSPVDNIASDVALLDLEKYPE